MIGPRYVTLRRRGSLVELPTAWMDGLYVLEEHRRQGALNAPALAFCRSPGVTILRRALEKLF